MQWSKAKEYGNRGRLSKQVSHGTRRSFWLVKIKFFIYYSCCGWSHWPKSKPNSSKGDWVTYLYFHEILLKTSCVLNVWAENKGRHPSTKVHFFSTFFSVSSRSTRMKTEILDLVSKHETEGKKFSISSRNMRLKGRNSRSRLEAWDWKEAILDLVSRVEIGISSCSAPARDDT